MSSIANDGEQHKLRDTLPSYLVDKTAPLGEVNGADQLHPLAQAGMTCSLYVRMSHERFN